MDPAEFPDQKNQREIWVRDITGLMAVVILAAAVVILAGTLAGVFAFAETLPVYIILAPTLLAWWVANHGGWRWAAPIPILLCFGLGAYSSINSGLSAYSVIFYALTVMLTGMLFGNRSGFLIVLVCVLAYIGLGSLHEGFSAGQLPRAITFTFGLLGLALLRWYTSFQLQKALQAQINSNELLKTEIFFREQAERAQHQHAEQLRRLADNTTDLVMEVDKNGFIQYASPSHRATLGWEPDALLATSAANLIHPNDLQLAWDAALEVSANRRAGSLQIRLRCADGQYLWVEISGRPLYDENGELSGYVLASRDITQQRQAETVIQESEKKFRKIIELLPLGVHMYALQEDGQLIFSGYNPAANDILGVDHAQFLGKPLEEAFPGLVEGGTAHLFHQIAASGAHWTENRLVYSHPPVQGIFDVHAFQTEPGKMVSVFSDITQRIKATEALHLSEEKFSTAFVTSPDSININRLADSVYLDINQGFTRLMGYSREDALGKSALELNIWVDPGDRDRLVKGLLENGVVENLEARFRRKNGDIGIGLMSARVIIIQGEKCILSITRDITEWIRAQVELRETHAQLERAYEATLHGWARALELRERETADHSRRVVEQTVCIARALGIEGEELVQIQRGALLHDIGKMGVPDEILLKPGPLTPEEWAIMHQHPEFARAMLSDIEYLRRSITIPYNHHERWDGSGYPQGLKGEAIPLPARIFAIVDVFDALTHDRPYRQAWSKAEACTYLIQQKGKQFDPTIVDLFLQINHLATDPG